MKRFLLLLVLLLPAAFAVDEYKPYLHEAVVPDHPEIKLFGQYSTELYPGAATYSYSVDLPRGTNGLTPSVALFYNSQRVKQRPGILGAGWFTNSASLPFRGFTAHLMDKKN